MKKILLLFLFAVVAAIGHSQVLNGFSNEKFVSNGNSLPYRLSQPTDQSKKYPLVVFLHGVDQRGTDNQKPLVDEAVGTFLKDNFKGDYESIMIVPQCSETDYWSNAMRKVGNKYEFIFDKETPTQSLSLVMDLIKQWIASGKVDTDRIYVGGLSMGGFGTYELLWRMPQTFAAAFPICGGTDLNAAKLASYASKTRLWMFHGSADDIVSVDFSRKAYTNLQQIKDSYIKYKEYPGVNHFSWNNAFKEKALIPWLFGRSDVELGYYKIAALSNNAAVTKVSQTLSLGNYSAQAGQSWIISSVTDDLYKIQVNDGSNLFLSANGTGISLSSSATTTKQYWKLIKSGKGIYQIVSAETNSTLTSTGSGIALVNGKTGKDDQKWKIAHTKLFLAGSATTAGWDINKTLEINAVVEKDGVFSWTGTLMPQEFKFQTTRSTAWFPTINSIAPLQYTEFGKEQKLVVNFDYQVDYKFTTKKTGYYNLLVDMVNKQMIVNEAIPSTLYMVGPAITSWDNTKTEALTSVANQEGVFTWEGYLKAGSFKFLIQRNTWYNSVNAVGANQTIVLNKDFGVAVTDGSVGDYLFNLPTSGFYTMTVDMKNKTMKMVEKVMPMSLYLLGDATSAGFDNNKAILMKEVSPKVYTWTGTLKPLHFKFITQLGTWNSIVPTFNANEPIINEYTHYLSTVFIGDHRFVVPELGEYTITVDMNTKTMVLNKLPNNTPIYLVGDACTAGWANANALRMDRIAEGVYTWTGNLNAGKQFKFLSKLGTWNSIVPARPANEYMTPGYKHEISNNYVGDYRFVVQDGGLHTIVVNLKDHSMTVKKSTGNPPIYLVGDATPNGWPNTLATPMTETAEGMYSWIGTLKAGQFKFITKLGTWNSIVPVPSANEAVILNKEHGISTYYRGDYRFVMSKTGTYKVNVDLKKHTMLISEATKAFVAKDEMENFSLVPSYGTVEVRINNAISVQNAELMSLSGSTIATAKDMNSAFYLGSDIPSGVYIVKIQSNNGVFVQKVIIK